MTRRPSPGRAAGASGVAMTIDLLAATAMLVSGVVTSMLAVVMARRRGGVGRSGLIVVFAGVGIWGVLYGLELAVSERQTKELFGAAKYVGVSLVTIAWLVFALEYTGQARRVTARLVAALAVVPCAVLVALAVPATRELVRSY